MKSENWWTDSEPDFSQGIREKTKRETPAPNLHQIPALGGTILTPQRFWIAERTAMMDRTLTLALTVAVVANTLCLWSYL
ncbi:hypothetical protein AFEL58S_01410 [Afipia felis]